MRNEKYNGDVISSKTYTIDAITHKRVVNNGEEDKYYVKDQHEWIISKEDWQKEQDILKSRTNLRMTGRRMSSSFSFSVRFRCGFCGHTYCKKSLYKRRPAWDCISVAKSGRMYCPDSKVIHEDVIKSCFMEAYFLLSKDNGLAIKEFVDSLKQAARDNEPKMMKARAEDERNKIKVKLSKLVDLYVEGKVDNLTFEMKQNYLNEKLQKLDDKLISLNNMIEADDKTEIGIKKIQTELQIRESANEIKQFDEDLFEALVDYGIIGGYDEKGNKSNYMIIFICKKGFNLRSREDISSNMIVENNQLDQENSIYNPIIDFVSNQEFFVYDHRG